MLLFKRGLRLLLDEASGTANITLYGPADRWLGFGLNASSMADTPYTLVVDADGKVSEHALGDHAPGSVLAPSVAVVSSTVSGGVRTTYLTRPLAGSTPAHYTFEPRALGARLPLISAVGHAATFGAGASHDYQARAPHRTLRG